MEKYEKNITEGVTFAALKTDKSKYDMITVNFLFPRNEETTAFSALLSAVIDRGTVNYPDMRSLEIAQEELYAASAEVYTRAMGECMCLTFSASYMNKAYTIEKEDITSPMLALLGELMFNPLTVDGGFLPQYVESEKKNQIDIIRSRKDNKSTYAVRRCVELMCENEAYAIPADGNEETVSRINGENLYEFHKRIISQCPVHIVFSGNADGEDIYNKLCENISFTPRASSLPQNVIIQKADEIKYFTEEMNISQSKLSIGCRTGIEEGRDQWLAFSVFKEIFAISPTSKLFMNVREKLSLCYYCSMVSQYIKGMFVISAGINACDKDKAYNAIMNELTAMKNGDFTDEEFDTAIRNIKSSFRGVTDSIRSINNFYFARYIEGKDISPLKAAEMLDTVTREDVIRCANNITADTVYFLKGGNGEDDN